MKTEPTTEFQTRLWDAVKSIERNSHLEVVVIVRSSSGSYHDMALTWGIIVAFLSYTYVMFAPDFFDDWLIYCTPIASFAFCYAIAHNPSIIRLIAASSRFQKNVEIMARALFQKGGIGNTRSKIGVLIYCSLLEKIVYILPDSGAKIALPADEWQILSDEFQKIFTSKKPGEALLEQLHKTESIFKQYAPQKTQNINELPDDMEIDL